MTTGLSICGPKNGIEVMKMEGFIPINRKLFEHWLWQDKPYAKGQAWIDLISLANFKDRKIPFKDGVAVLKRGEINSSLGTLAVRWGWSRMSVKRFLNVLECDKMVTVNSTTHGTVITLVNYSLYNNECSTDVTTNGQPVCNQWAASVQPMGNQCAQ